MPMPDASCMSECELHMTCPFLQFSVKPPIIREFSDLTKIKRRVVESCASEGHRWGYNARCRRHFAGCRIYGRVWRSIAYVRRTGRRFETHSAAELKKKLFRPCGRLVTQERAPREAAASRSGPVLPCRGPRIAHYRRGRSPAMAPPPLRRSARCWRRPRGGEVRPGGEEVRRARPRRAHRPRLPAPPEPASSGRRSP